MPTATESASAPVNEAPPNPVRFNTLCNQLDQYLDLDQVRRVYRAYLFSAERHSEQWRMSGEPYITHPLSVACTLADLHLDADTIVAALLHDVIEDTPTARDQIRKEFGEDVAHLVDGVSKLTHLAGVSRSEAQAANFSKMMLAMVRDIRVMLVKLADRLHNMRTLQVLPREKQRRIARETLEVYMPIARRLGMNAFCLELESRAFEALYPMRSHVLKKAIRAHRGRQYDRVEKIRKNVIQHIEERDIKAQIEGREKSIYSIYCKMRDKHLSFNEVFDVYGFRVIVDTVDQCYRVLGVAHGLYKPLPGKFKDYIAIPKANGYQSLHTALQGPDAVPLELQVRTQDMERVAEGGVAAHWNYKTGTNLYLPTHAKIWMQSILDIRRQAPDSVSFLEHVKVDLFPHEVYVFTPAGDILRLPQRATALDFAYAVHSGVGNACVGVKIDRVASPLSTELSSGQTIEILTTPHGKPSPAWLDFVVTAKARSSIRQYLKGLKEEQAEELGLRLLDKALNRFGKTFADMPDERVSETLEAMKIKDVQQLFRDIGLGRLMAPIAANQLVGSSTSSRRSIEWLGRMLGRRQDQPVALQGTEGMAVTFAKCCRPIPGDTVTGIASASHGLVIHRSNCPNLKRFRKSPEQWIPCEWAETVNGEYPVSIRVSTKNRRGLLARVAAAIAEQGSNIAGVNIEEAHGANISMGFILNVRDRIHLATIIKAVRRLPDVHKVVRLSG